MKLRKAMAMMMVCTIMTGSVLTVGAEETVESTATKITQSLARGGMRGNFASKVKGFFNRNGQSRLTDEEIQERHDAMIKVYAKLAGVTEEEAKTTLDADRGAIRTLISEKNIDIATVQETINELYPDGLPGGFGRFGGNVRGGMKGGMRGSRLTDEEIQERHDAMIKVYAKLAGVTEEEAKTTLDADRGAVRKLVTEQNIDIATVQETINELYPDGIPGGFGRLGGNARGGMRGGMHRGARGAYGFTVKAYAEVAGISVDEAIALCQETGKTLYELAEEKGLTDELQAKIKELATDLRSRFSTSTTNEDL